MKSAAANLESDIVEAKRLLGMSRRAPVQSLLIACACAASCHDSFVRRFIEEMTAKEVDLLTAPDESATPSPPAGTVAPSTTGPEPRTASAWTSAPRKAVTHDFAPESSATASAQTSKPRTAVVTHDPAPESLVTASALTNKPMKPGTPDPESLETAPVPTSEPTQDGTLSATASAPASEPTKPGTPDPESLASVPPVERGTREGAPSPPTETTDVFLPPRIEHGEVPVAVPQRVEGAQQAETPREVWSPITSFSWDQGSFETPWVNVVVNMAGVSEEKVWCKFDVDMFDLKIKTSAGNFRLFRNALDQDIIPAKSRVVVKTGRVTVKLRKAPSDVEPEPGKPTSYEAWNTLGKKGGRRERELEKAPRVEDSEYYEIARLMYEEGNDAIRRQIGEAYERNKRREMEEGPEPLKAILEATSSSVPPYPSYFPQSAARASSSR